MKIRIGNRIYFANAFLNKWKSVKGEHKVYYIIRKYKVRSCFGILIDISEHVTLLKLMDYLVHFNHAISVVGYWIFDSSYGKSLALNRESLDITCAPYFGKK